MTDRAALLEAARVAAHEARAAMLEAAQAQRALGYATGVNLLTVLVAGLDVLPTRAIALTMGVWGYFFAGAAWRQVVSSRALAEMTRTGAALFEHMQEEERK